MWGSFRFLLLFFNIALFVAANETSASTSRSLQQQRKKEEDVVAAKEPEPAPATEPSPANAPAPAPAPSTNKQPTKVVESLPPPPSPPSTSTAPPTYPPTKKPSTPPTEPPTEPSSDPPTDSPTEPPPTTAPTPSPVRALPGAKDEATTTIAATTKGATSTIGAASTIGTTSTISALETTTTALSNGIVISTTTSSTSTTSSASIAIDETYVPTPSPIETAKTSSNQIQLTFIGSTNARYSSSDITDIYISDDTVLKDVTEAFWKVCLHVLSELFVDVDDEENVGDVDDVDGVDAVQASAKLKSAFGSGDTDERWVGMDWEEDPFAGKLGKEASLLFQDLERVVEDVECPEGLVYAPPSSQCLEFTFTLIPIPEGPVDASYTQFTQYFIEDFSTATNYNGDLYTSIVEINPNSAIVGIGSPGGGIPYESNPDQMAGDAIISGDIRETVKLGGGPRESNIGTGGIVGVAISMGVVIILLVNILIRVIPNS